MAEHSLITYQELTNAANTYHQRADQILEIKDALLTLNNELASAWQNNTADSFFERYETEYKPGLENTAQALESISTFITTYVTKQQELDQEISSSIKSGV